jgi:calcineurin-like phosphoesterase family protein
MKYITSDLHFYHKHIVDYQPNRKVDNLDDMHSKIIQEWNSLVKDNDTIYHLGDFSFKNGDCLNKIVSQLNGNKVFILGNHDNENALKLHGKTYQYLEITHNNFDICLFHFPITHWHNQEKGSLHFHGHTHGAFNNHGRSIDVGYDKHGKILLLDEAIKMVSNKDIIKRNYTILPI